MLILQIHLGEGKRCAVFFSVGKRYWKEGKWVISHVAFADLTVLLTAVWRRNLTEPKFDSWSIKLAQTKVPGRTLVGGLNWPK
jgi:hypothetical protein